MDNITFPISTPYSPEGQGNNLTTVLGKLTTFLWLLMTTIKLLSWAGIQTVDLLWPNQTYYSKTFSYKC